MTTTTRINERPEPCSECGATVPAGEGHLWWQPAPDDGGDVVGRTSAGWRVAHADRAACDAERKATRDAQAKLREEAVARARARQAAEDAARAAQQAEIAALLAEVPDCVAAGYAWSSSVLRKVKTTFGHDFERVEVAHLSLAQSADPALSGLSLGRSSWYRVTAVTGETCYLHEFGNARVLHAPRSVVERAWALLADPADWERGYKPQVAADLAAQYAPEAAAAWLAKYGPESPRVVDARQREAAGQFVGFDSKPCAEWEAHAWHAGRLDLLTSEGVI